jgi:hypothetical protein
LAEEDQGEEICIADQREDDDGELDLLENQELPPTREYVIMEGSLVIREPPMGQDIEPMSQGAKLMSQGAEVVMEHGPLVMEPQVVYRETRADPLASIE